MRWRQSVTCINLLATRSNCRMSMTRSTLLTHTAHTQVGRLSALYPVYMIEQTSGKRRANVFKIHVLIARRLLDRVNGFIQLARWTVVISMLIRRTAGCNWKTYITRDSCRLSLGLYLIQGAGFHQACLMFARSCKRSIILRLHEKAYMKQTHSLYTCTTCALSLLHKVCFLV